MEPVNACNFLRNKDIWKRTSPLCSSSNSSPKTCITLPPSHLKCSTEIQYGRLQNGGRQVTPPNDFPLGLIRSHMVVIYLFLMLCDLQRMVRDLCPTLYFSSISLKTAEDCRQPVTDQPASRALTSLECLKDCLKMRLSNKIFNRARQFEKKSDT